MSEIQAGDRVLVRTAFDQWRPRRALSGVLPGHRFEVVWACRPEEWDAAQVEGREAEGVPWPAEDVKLDDPQYPAGLPEQEGP